MVGTRDPAEETRRARTSDPDDLLLEYVRERDVACPACGYNLRNLTVPACPECCERLHLRVSHDRPGFGLFVLAIAPSIASAVFVGIFLTMVTIYGAAGVPIEVVLTVIFLAASALAGLALFALRERFIRVPCAAQIAVVVSTWIVHITAFGMFVGST